jgi:hypothetical protein
MSTTDTRLSANADDRTRTKLELAIALLQELFNCKQRIIINDAVAAAAERGVSRRTLIRASKILGATFVSNGNLPGFWELAVSEDAR